MFYRKFFNGSLINIYWSFKEIWICWDFCISPISKYSEKGNSSNILLLHLLSCYFQPPAPKYFSRYPLLFILFASVLIQALRSPHLLQGVTCNCFPCSSRPFSVTCPQAASREVFPKEKWSLLCCLKLPTVSPRRPFRTSSSTEHPKSFPGKKNASPAYFSSLISPHSQPDVPNSTNRCHPCSQDQPLIHQPNLSLDLPTISLLHPLFTNQLLLPSSKPPPSQPRRQWWPLTGLSVSLSSPIFLVPPTYQ